MVTVTIVSLGCVVNLDGSIIFTLKDTANTYADGSNPTKTFTVIPKALTMSALNSALLLAKEDAIDYFNREATKIATRNTIVTAMNSVTIPNPIFTGDPSTYTKTSKVGK